MEDSKPAPVTAGQVIHWAFWYDVLIWAITLGRERTFREKQIELAHLAPGESVLDVGCGTGSLAMVAKQRVGPTGKVSGIDASPEMISRALKRARKAGVEVTFENAVVEAIPFPNASFDAVVSTVMLHHLPDDARHQCLSEIRRVLKPGGRLTIVDFGGSEKQKHSWTARYHKHAHFDIRKVIPELNEVGMCDVESGEVGVRDLWFVRASAPAAV
jgi:ubiquinone/menaquinone biosynthesis C-methylase UbiE